MKIDEALFPVHTIDLKNSKVLIRPDQAEGAKGKNMIIGDKMPITVNDKILAREVVQKKTPDGEKTLRINVKAVRPGARGFFIRRSVCCSGKISQNGCHHRSDRFDRSDRICSLVRPVWWPVLDIQAKATKSGYQED